MSVNPVPAGFTAVTPYLVIADAPGLIDFLKAAFGAKVVHRMDGPDGQVAHADLTIDGAHIMMGQSSAAHPAMPAMVHLYVADADAAYKQALGAGAESVKAPSDEFYGDRAGGVKDKHGNVWWIATHKEDVPEEELKRRMSAMKAGK